MEKLIGRINELAAKKKNGTISPAELEEQAKLRQEYIAIFRSNFKEHISQIKVVDEEGNDVTPEKVKQLRTNNVVN